MDYLKGVVATVAAFFLATLVPKLGELARGISTQKATGLSAVAAGLLESIISPWFWILALVFSVFFYFSARFKNEALRILLFWIPAVATSVTGLGCWALLTVVVLRLGGTHG